MDRQTLLQKGRLLSVRLGTGLLALWAAAEWVLAYPVAWWLYAPLLPVFAFGLIAPIAPARQRGHICAFMLVAVLIGLLHWVPWTSRKPFLREIGRAHV